MWLQLMWLQFEVVRGRFGVVCGRFGAGLEPKPAPKAAPKDPEGKASAAGSSTSSWLPSPAAQLGVPTSRARYSMVRCASVFAQNLIKILLGWAGHLPDHLADLAARAPKLKNVTVVGPRTT